MMDGKRRQRRGLGGIFLSFPFLSFFPQNWEGKDDDDDDKRDQERGKMIVGWFNTPPCL